jgi:uncharacterized protein YndB with AHSA1/START domain
MWHASESLTIAAPPDAVWDVVADIDGHVGLAGSGEVKAIRFEGPLEAGATFEGDIATGEVGSFVSRNVIHEVDEPRRLVWRSYPPLDEDETPDHQIEVIWSFTLTPTPDGTEVVHGFEVPRPKAGADDLAAFLERTDRVETVKTGMRKTLENLRRAVESEP